MRGRRPFSRRAALVISNARCSICVAAVSEEPESSVKGLDTRRGLETGADPLGNESGTATGAAFGFCAKVSGMIDEPNRMMTQNMLLDTKFRVDTPVESIGGITCFARKASRKATRRL